MVPREIRGGTAGPIFFVKRQCTPSMTATGRAYTELPQVFCPGAKARSFTVSTLADLKEALAAPHDSMIFLELIMDPTDTPNVLIESGLGSANLNFGPRGPQHRAGIRI